jgi:hypothetical protein
MNQTIKKLIVEPLIYPFYKENYKKTLFGGFVILSLWILILFPNFSSIISIILFGSIVGLFILGYCLTVFIFTLRGNDTLPNLTDKEVFLNGLKIGGVLLFLSIPSLIVCLYLIPYNLALPYLFTMLIWLHFIMSMILLLFSCLLLPSPISTKTLAFIQSYNVKLFLILAMCCYFLPLIIFNLYNKKVGFKKLLKILISHEYVLIIVIFWIYLLLILKVAIYLMFVKPFIVFYLFIVIARMFGVYFRDFKNI